MADEANSQKAYEDEKRLAAASNVGYGKSYGGPYDDLVEEMKRIWYSEYMRTKIPDLITLSIDWSAVPVFGIGLSFQLNLLTRGREPGVFFTNTPSLRKYFEVDAGFNIGVARYMGNPYDIERSSVTGKIQDVNAGYIFGVNVWRGFDNDGMVNWYGVKAGVGTTFGLSYGEGNTSFGWIPVIPYGNHY